MDKEYVQRMREYRRQNTDPWLRQEDKIEPNSLIDVVHGGTTQYINRFLQGKEKGYRLERGGLGLQVEPRIGMKVPGTGREVMYAGRAAGSYGGTPGILKAQIPVKYVSRANNVYEAAITPEVVKHLQNVQVTPVTSPQSGLAPYTPAEETFGSFRRK
jgi:hypothetical protein